MTVRRVMWTPAARAGAERELQRACSPLSGSTAVKSAYGLLWTASVVASRTRG